MVVLDAGFERFGSPFQGGARLLVPGEVRGLLGPEGLGIAEGVRLHIVLGVGGHSGGAGMVSWCVDVWMNVLTLKWRIAFLILELVN